ncbi:MAG: GDP-mannose 4,6-dehydratase [Candidatus Hadarchaeales archaeon]
MRVLVTGGAGFIGRWVVRRLLSGGLQAVAYDNLSSGSLLNIREFMGDRRFKFIRGDISDKKRLREAFKDIGVCVHLAAQINVQRSIDNPEETFRVNVIGTHNVLEECRRHDTKLVLVGTCLVYDTSQGKPMSEDHPVKPASPYASSKLAGEELALSYFRAYGLPVVVTRPFNTYGPFQRGDTEGGVVSIFIRRKLEGKPLLVFGDGKQTRDLLYVEDCADFIIKAMESRGAVGEIINAGTGRDVSINELALMICKNPKMIKHVKHPHPQAEIRKLVCDFSKAEKLLGWKPTTSLEEGIRKTEQWMAGT